MIEIPFCPSIFDRNIIAFDEPNFFQSSSERSGKRREWGRRLAAEEPDHRHRRLLGARRERPRCCHATKDLDKFAPPHGFLSRAEITLSYCFDCASQRFSAAMTGVGYGERAHSPFAGADTGGPVRLPNSAGPCARADWSGVVSALNAGLRSVEGLPSGAWVEQTSHSVTALPTFQHSAARGVESSTRPPVGLDETAEVGSRTRCKDSAAAPLRFSRAVTRKPSRRQPSPAATRDWCCARSAANVRANDPRH